VRHSFPNGVPRRTRRAMRARHGQRRPVARAGGRLYRAVPTSHDFTLHAVVPIPGDRSRRVGHSVAGGASDRTRPYGRPLPGAVLATLPVVAATAVNDVRGLDLVACSSAVALPVAGVLATPDRPAYFSHALTRRPRCAAAGRLANFPPMILSDCSATPRRWRSRATSRCRRGWNWWPRAGGLRPDRVDRRLLDLFALVLRYDEGAPARAYTPLGSQGAGPCFARVGCVRAHRESTTRPPWRSDAANSLA